MKHEAGRSRNDHELRQTGQSEKGRPVMRPPKPKPTVRPTRLVILENPKRLLVGADSDNAEAPEEPIGSSTAAAAAADPSGSVSLIRIPTRFAKFSRNWGMPKLRRKKTSWESVAEQF